MMRKKKLACLIAAAAAWSCISVAAATPCADLATLDLPDTTITVAAIAPSGSTPVPAQAFDGMSGPLAQSICRVAGVIKPTPVSNIQFEVWMPVSGWNGKFNGVGGAGLSGFIAYGDMQKALARNYATASTDAGHEAFLLDGSWMQGHPELVKDFAIRAHHVTAVAAKAIVKRYYGEPARHAYFTGCSNGGEEGLSEAQRFPQDYDGIVAGAPANYPTHMWPGEVYPAWLAQANPQGMISKLALIQSAAIAACDKLDGLEDGLIDDPRKCHFDPAAIQCSGADGPNCLTKDEVDWTRKIHAGLHNPGTGKSFWPGYEQGSELGWDGHIVQTIDPPLAYFRYLIYGDANWNFPSFDFNSETDFAVILAADKTYAPVLDAINPDISGFRARRGKLILYHGWADQNIGPRNTVSYYESVVNSVRNARHHRDAEDAIEETKSFARLFMAPGMQHCGGGYGPNTFDALGALEKWVESGKAPDQIVASHANSSGTVDRTRPLCPYPQKAVYRGHGSIDDAANFACGAGTDVDERDE
jgi:feruloyl esterase